MSGEQLGSLSPPSSSSCPAPQMSPPPWNPRTLAQLGLIFGPIWSGIMTAINARRLKSDGLVWRAPVLGIGATVIAILLCVEYELRDSFVTAALYLGTLWFIWRFDLRPQLRAYEARGADQPPTSRWRAPVVAGCVAIAFFAAPFVVPLFPPPGYARLGWKDLEGVWVEVPEMYIDDWPAQRREAYLQRFKNNQAGTVTFSTAAMALTSGNEIVQSGISLPCMIDPNQDKLHFSFYNDAMPGKHAIVTFQRRDGKLNGRMALEIYDQADSADDVEFRFAGVYRRAEAETVPSSPHVAAPRETTDYDLARAVQRATGKPVYDLLTQADTDFNQGRLDSAIAALDRAIASVSDENRPLKSHLLARRADCHLRSGNKDAAMADYDLAFANGCVLPRPFSNRGCVFLEQGKYEAAIADFTRSIELDSQYALVYYRRGLAYAKIGKGVEAERDFARARELDPNVEQRSRFRVDTLPPPVTDHP